MSFDTDAYIRALAAAHGLAAKPDDADGSELTVRAVRTELADINRRAQALRDWTTAVIAAGPQGRDVDPAQNRPPHPGCRCAQRRPDRRPGCRCGTRRR